MLIEKAPILSKDGAFFLGLKIAFKIGSPRSSADIDYS